MMLNSYVPNSSRRYAIAGLVIAMVTPLAAIVYEMLVGAGMAHAGYEFLTSPFGLAAVVAPLGVTTLITGLAYRHDRLARQIRSERAATEQLRKAAYHDSLTGLRNRHALNEDIERLIRCRNDKSPPLALLLIDLDHFKFINDTMGHAAGDLVLTTLAGRLQAYCSAGQRVYRLGGDEFVLLWENAPEREAISRFCDDLSASVFRPVVGCNGMIDTAGSIGSTVSDAEATSLSELLKCADLALYDAKSRPGSGHSFFTQDMDDDQRQRQQIEEVIRGGIAAGTFQIDYRPVVKAVTLSVSGFTAQLRWPRSDKAAPEDAQFMAIAEASGLIVPLGRWMLERALNDASTWRDQADITLPVSAIELRDPGYAASVISALDTLKFDPGRLVFDVGANAIRGEGHIVLGNLERLREKGVKISVSEFAASIAGLSMTRAFPVDRVRLDLAAIRSIAGEERLEQMLTLFLQLALTVETPVILTGVDSMEDLTCACAVGAETVQGAFAGTRLSGLQASRYFIAIDGPAQTLPEKADMLKTA